MEYLGKALVGLIAAAATLAVTSLLLTPFFPLRDCSACFGLLFWLAPPVFVLTRTNQIWEATVIRSREKRDAARADAVATRIHQTAVARTKFDDTRCQFTQQLSDIPNLFWFVTSKGSSVQKDKFETEAEFYARFPKRDDTTSTFYIPITDSFPSIEYSTDTHLLTLKGPHITYLSVEGHVIRFQVANVFKKWGTSTKHTSLGIAVEVTQRDWHQYQVTLHTPVSPMHLIRDGHLCLSGTVNRDYARVHERAFQLILGMRLLDWNLSSVSSVPSRWNNEYPSEGTDHTYVLAAAFESVHLINKNTREQFSECRFT